MSLPRLKLMCFGAPTAQVDGGEPAPDVLWRKHLALLVYLAMSPEHQRTRDHLLGLLWPEKAQEKARHSLNEALRRLRASLGADRLISRGEAVQINADGLDIDAIAFERTRNSDPAAALKLVRGDFLEGFGVEGAPDFEDWAAQQRGRFRASAGQLLIDEGQAALAESRFDHAEQVARNVMGIDPTSERAASLLVTSLALAGDAAGALAAYHEFGQHLQRDIGEQPGRALQELAERVRAGRWRRAATTDRDVEPPLVGRGKAHRVAFTTLEEVLNGAARGLVIQADPGMGKTRLLAECVDRLSLAGARVVVASPLESDHDAPWSTLRLLGRSGLVDAPGVVAADPRALSVLASLIPELADRFQPVEPKDHTDVAGAVASILRATAEEGPIAIAIDDAQFADGPTIGALGAAVRQLRNEPVALVIAVDRTAQAEPRELVSLKTDIGRAIPGASVRLDPLSDDELRALAAALATWCDDPSDRDRLTRRLGHETGGSPFLAVTLLRGLDKMVTLKDDLLTWPPARSTLESPLPFSLPDLARIAIVARLGELDEDERLVLQAASIGGNALDLELVAQLADVSSELVERVLDRLERLRFVTYDGSRYAFPAALIAEVVRTELSTPGQRQRFRKRAAQLLAERDDLEARVLRVELLARAEPTAQVFEEAMTVARSAAKQGSTRTARRALFAAERAARKIADDAKRAAVEQLRASLAG